jgi:prepilin-type processing-associated H-X9-DG protein
MVGGYIKDAKVFFCPSATGMPWDAGAQYAGLTRTDVSTLIGMTGLDDAGAMCCGNYLQMALANGAPNNLTTGWQNTKLAGGIEPAYGFQCSYNYRGVPISTGKGNLLGKGVSTGTGIPQDVYGNPYADFTDTTSPGIWAYAGCPQFKTQKFLGNRSIVADTFSKWDEAPTGSGMGDTASMTVAMTQGYGIYAHRDSYNVLYGDWHVKITDDSTKKIVNWSTANAGGNVMNLADVSSSIATIAYPTTVASQRTLYTVMPTYNANGTGTGDVTPSEGFAIWHFLDQQEGMDIKGNGGL